MIKTISAKPVGGSSELSPEEKSIYRTLERVADKVGKEYDCANCSDVNRCNEGEHCIKDLRKQQIANLKWARKRGLKQ